MKLRFDMGEASDLVMQALRHREDSETLHHSLPACLEREKIQAEWLIDDNGYTIGLEISVAVKTP